MNFAIVEPATETQLLNRLNDVEKIQIRMLDNEDQLDSYRWSFLTADGPPSLETMVAVRETLYKRFCEAGALSNQNF